MKFEQDSNGDVIGLNIELLKHPYFARLVADANRYRWLRDSAGNEILDKLKTKILTDSFDAEIDQAMSEKG